IWFRQNPKQPVVPLRRTLMNHTITITRTGNALSVSQDPLRVRPQNNDTLCWTCSGGDFAILFKNSRSPYSSGRKVHGAHSATKTKKLKIRQVTAHERDDFPESDPVNGATFEYGVAVVHPTTNQLLTLDPDVIIDDPGGGGGNG